MIALVRLVGRQPRTAHVQSGISTRAIFECPRSHWVTWIKNCIISSYGELWPSAPGGALPSGAMNSILICSTAGSGAWRVDVCKLNGRRAWIWQPWCWQRLNKGWSATSQLPWLYTLCLLFDPFFVTWWDNAIVDGCLFAHCILATSYPATLFACDRRLEAYMSRSDASVNLF